MKEIKAYIRRSRMDEVIHGLIAIGVTSMSVIPVEGVGSLADPETSELSLNYVTSYSMIYKLELVCRAEDADLIVETLQQHARTGAKGDGAIFVSNVERAVRIWSGKEGKFALDSPRGGSDNSAK